MKTTLTVRQALKVLNILIKMGRLDAEEHMQCISVLAESDESCEIVMNLDDGFHRWYFAVGDHFSDTVFDSASIDGNLPNNIHEELVSFINNIKE